MDASLDRDSSPVHEHERTPSPFPPPTNSSTERDPQQRLSNAERWQRFNEYLQFSNIITRRPTSASDPDTFYNDSTDNKMQAFDCEYMFGPRDLNGRSQSSDNVLDNAYDVFDVHKTQVLRAAERSHQNALFFDDSLSMKNLSPPGPPGGYPFAEFKNNIVECWGRFIFCAAWSRLVILKDDKLLCVVETEPPFTVESHMRAAVNPYSPHSINYMKVVNFKDRDTLVICCDDGRGVLYDLENFSKTQNLDVSIQFLMSHSVWGVDAKGDYIAFSDNSQRVTFLYQNENSVYFEKSINLLHNITDLKIVSITEDKIFVACVSISSELVTFEVSKTRIIGPSDRPLKAQPIIDTTSSDHIQCEYKLEMSVLYRTTLGDQGWSIQQVDKRYFKTVHNVDYLGLTSQPIDTSKLLQKSSLLDMLDNQLVTSSLGGGAKYETVLVNTSHGVESDLNRLDSRLNTMTDRIHRIRKDYFGLSKDLPELDNKFYIVTTIGRVGLYRANGLICNAETNDICVINNDEDFSFSNRLSITRIIPEISAYITISQIGTVTIFRMVQFRGLYSLREEFTFSMGDEEDGGLELTVGCGIRKVYDGIYWVYIMNIHGGFLKLELSESDADELFVTFV